MYILIQEDIKKMENSKKIFILDAALIYEANFQSLFDSTLLITSTKKNRLDRNLNTIRFSIEQFTKRMALQMSDRKKISIADRTITNDKSLPEFHKKLNYFYKNTINL